MKKTGLVIILALCLSISISLNTSAYKKHPKLSMPDSTGVFSSNIPSFSAQGAVRSGGGSSDQGLFDELKQMSEQKYLTPDNAVVYEAKPTFEWQTTHRSLPFKTNF